MNQITFAAVMGWSVKDMVIKVANNAALVVNKLKVMKIALT